MVYAGAPPQPNHAPDGQESGWVALVSGLDIDGTDLSRLDARCDVLVEWLNGEIGCDEEKRLARRVSRLVIAGNSVRPPSACVEPLKVKEDKKPVSV